MVGIDAFDLREDEIDITPWLPVLCDGKMHSYEIRVVGLTDDGQGNAAISTIGGYWVVTGKLFLWLDSPDSSTSGTPPTMAIPNPSFFVTSQTSKAANGSNATLNYQVLAQRQVSISNTIITSGGSQAVSWSQTLSYSNIANFVANGNNQTNNIVTSGSDVSSNGYSRKFAYPLNVFSAVSVNPSTKAMTIWGRIDRSKNTQLLGSSVFPSPLDTFANLGPFDGMMITNRQNATAFFLSDPSQNASTGSGSTEQDYILKGTRNTPVGSSQVPIGAGSIQLYARHVLAANNSVRSDSQTGNSRTIQYPTEVQELANDFAIIQPADVTGGKVIPGLRSWWT